MRFPLRIIILVATSAFLSRHMFSQTPQKMSYQAVVRNTGGALVTNQSVGMKISILQGTSTGSPVYVETQTAITNINGLVTLEIGGGTPVTGTFAGIDWSAGPYFIKTETDPAGGISYTITGTSQILSVPYSLLAKKAIDLSIPNQVAGDLLYFDGVNWVRLPKGSPGQAMTVNSSGDYIWVNHFNSPIASTSAATAITSTGATLNGLVNANGLSTVVTFEHGSSTSYGNSIVALENPVTGASNVNVSALLNGLVFGSTYHFRVKAVNELGISYGNDKTFTIDCMYCKTVSIQNNIVVNEGAESSYCGEELLAELAIPDIIVGNTTTKVLCRATSIYDIDGNIYNTVFIGAQIWMAENLKTNKYNNGDPIATTTPSTLNISTENSPKYFWSPNGNDLNITTYGKLYTWYVATDNRKLCPIGWHLPTDAEWTTLENYLIAKAFNFDGTTTGNKIAKAMASTTLWSSSTNTGAVGNNDYPAKRNITNFTGIPSGNRYVNGSFSGFNFYANWWSGSENDASTAWSHNLGYDYNYTYRSSIDKKEGYSVRCLKDN